MKIRVSAEDQIAAADALKQLVATARTLPDLWSSQSLSELAAIIRERMAETPELLPVMLADAVQQLADQDQQC